jgi:hypothetical protein
MKIRFFNIISSVYNLSRLMKNKGIINKNERKTIKLRF